MFYLLDTNILSNLVKRPQGVCPRASPQLAAIKSAPA
jgi:hypothetical protein